MRLQLRFEQGEALPQPGATLRMQGMAGEYAVTIKRVLTSRIHPDDGAILLEVQASRRLMIPRSRAEMRVP